MHFGLLSNIHKFSKQKNGCVKMAHSPAMLERSSFLRNEVKQKKREYFDRVSINSRRKCLP